MIRVEHIQASITHTGDRIDTLVLEYPRCIHAQLLTHRVFSKNSSSSRAVPLEKAIAQILDNPAEYLWTQNQAGMQGKVITGKGCLHDLEETFHTAKENMMYAAQKLQSLGAHKQNAARLLEPFQNIKIVLTSTEWENWDWLRDDPAAQGEIAQLARMIKEARENADVMYLNEGEWHVPFVSRKRLSKGELVYTLNRDVSGTDTLRSLSPEEAILVSTSVCAQTSYRNADYSLEKAIDLKAKLFGGNKIHCYDEQTEVLTEYGFLPWSKVNKATKLAAVDQHTGLFTGFEYPTELINEDYSGKMYHYDSDAIDLLVTPEHKLYAHRIRTNSDRRGIVSPTLFACNERNSSKAKYRTAGESAMKMLQSTTGSNQVNTFPWLRGDQHTIGQLVGMFIGDGSVSFENENCNVLRFRFKKTRKIEYMDSLIAELALESSSNVGDDGVTNYSIKQQGLGNLFREMFYDGARAKCIPDSFMQLSQKFLDGFFDGLKNSDGSIKRNTWVYSTTSSKLVESLVALGAISGYSLTVGESQKGCYTLNVATKQYALLNDSRSDSRVSIVDYEGRIYCAEVSGHVLVVRRNGKVCLSGNSSPSEHQATPVLQFEDDGNNNSVWPAGITHIDRYGNYWSGNFKGFIQHRQLLSGHDAAKFIYE